MDGANPSEAVECLLRYEVGGKQLCFIPQAQLSVVRKVACEIRVQQDAGCN